uniref:Putative secreted peptide n=1 Tax=Anopheles braziliensis TaxID=58242 RepID=A0A2M3ZNF4_9DIPT
MLPRSHRLLWLQLQLLLQWPLLALPLLQLRLPQTKLPNQRHRHRLRLQRNHRELPVHRLRQHRHPKSPHLGPALLLAPLLQPRQLVNHQLVLRWRPRRHQALRPRPLLR